MLPALLYSWLGRSFVTISFRACIGDWGFLIYFISIEMPASSHGSKERGQIIWWYVRALFSKRRIY